MKHVDVAIVGAGIMGLAHAVHAARAGLSVAVFERGSEARGASVQNFGMLAIVAQAPGRQLDSARLALAHWKDVAACAGVDLAPAGCLFVARLPEEISVLEEFAAAASQSGHAATIVPRRQLHRYAPDLEWGDILGAMWSPDAWKLDQRRALSQIVDWLRREFGVAFHFNAEVRAAAPPAIETSIGSFAAEQVILCSGDEFDALFPEAFQATGVTHCALQMLRTHPQPAGWRLQPFLVGGLSLPRYGAFAACASLPALIARQRQRYGAHLAHGVHVIAGQERDGSVTIGDSHTYGDAALGERSPKIDRLILDDLAGMARLPDPRIAERWIGRYASLPGTEFIRMTPAAGVTAITMTNGQGMTHAFAIAAETTGDLW